MARSPRRRYGNANEMNFEAPLTSLVWITSIVSIVLTYVVSYFVIPDLGGDVTQWWKLATIISCGTLAGAVIPELVKVFTSTESRHVREVVISAQEGGASLGILSGFVAGNFSGYYLGLSMVALMSIGYYMSTLGLALAARCWLRRCSPSDWWPLDSWAWGRSRSPWIPTAR